MLSSLVDSSRRAWDRSGSRTAKARKTLWRRSTWFSAYKFDFVLDTTLKQIFSKREKQMNLRVDSLFMLIPFWRALCIAKLTGRTTRASRYLARNTARGKFSLRLCRVMRGWCLRSPDFFGGLLKTSLPGDPFYIHIECTSILLLLYVLWAQHVMRTGWESIHGISGCPHIPKGPDDLNSRTEMAWANKKYFFRNILRKTNSNFQ